MKTQDKSVKVVKDMTVAIIKGYGRVCKNMTKSEKFTAGAMIGTGMYASSILAYDLLVKRDAKRALRNQIVIGTAQAWLALEYTKLINRKVPELSWHAAQILKEQGYDDIPEGNLEEWKAVIDLMR